MRTLAAIGLFLLHAPALAAEANLLALGAGALPVAEPPAYSGWGVLNVLDDAPGSGWASAKGNVAGNTFVFEVPAPSTFSSFAFDTAGIDAEGAGARAVVVEVSATSPTDGFQTVLRASLADRADDQAFPAQARVEGRFVRLVITDNHGSDEYTELMGFRGFGTQAPQPPVPDVSGTWDTDYHEFHVRQQGAFLSGCYEYDEGLFEGTLEGRVARLGWSEGPDERGPAVFVFAPDGKTFRGVWWRDTAEDRAPGGDWSGTFASSEVGRCPHWSGSIESELQKDLAQTGRATLHGILFDTDKAVIRAESRPALDEVVALLAEESGWKLLIEGHTDATGSPEHNQALSEQRAAAVRDYLVSKGVAADRLETAGFGASKPVADNATELGRAQNRRVELVRR